LPGVFDLAKPDREVFSKKIQSEDLTVPPGYIGAEKGNPGKKKLRNINGPLDGILESSGNGRGKNQDDYGDKTNSGNNLLGFTVICV
jgi:hypothetical protein